LFRPKEDAVYRWIVFIHIASVLGLLLVHPVTVAFHLKEERDDTRIRELLEVSEAASTLRWVFFGLTVLSGVLLGFMGSWWGSAWIWAALVVFLLIAVVMNRYGGRTIDEIADTKDDAEMERLLSRFRPGILAVSGTGGLLLILYLMLFKPTL
jgi:4-hydroxybenzoate polyprenyltransferase